MADCQKGISGIRENFWPAWVEIINDDYLWQKPVHALYLKYAMRKKVGNGNEYLIPRGPKTQIAGKHVVAWFRLQKCLKIIHINVPNSFIEAGGSLHWPVSRLLLNRKVLWTQFRENKKHWQPRLRRLANWVVSFSRVSRQGKCECTERAGVEGTRTIRSRICSTPTHFQHWTPVERSSKAEFCVKPTWNGIRPVWRDGVSVYTYFDSVDYNSFKNNI